MENYDKYNHIYSISLKTGIEIEIIKKLQSETHSNPKRLKREFIPTILSHESFDFNMIPQGKIVELPGISFKLPSRENGYGIISKLRNELEDKNYRIFLDIYWNDDINEIIDLSILSCSNEFEPLIYMQTNGINYGVTNQKLINELRILDQELRLKILGAGNDWCEFEITQEPDNMSNVIKQFFELCPDIADKYNYSVNDFENYLRENKRLYLWFD
ncbi:DUF4253 domain-containing protein [Chryseobacterium scophthalmum]|uniref:DUF4253 domain-containing protein n=1 Tax=Chryseobacterium TaxID=59732 RepID=UPI002A6B1C83|nr:DUF4253 domain-containing protein [Chryseobacterium sp. CFBP8996]MDY0929609.1 DUF4253 domain-containing protein [Chryseobacterium sp. CFBP8996]